MVEHYADAERGDRVRVTLREVDQTSHESARQAAKEQDCSVVFEGRVTKRENSNMNDSIHILVDDKLRDETATKHIKIYETNRITVFDKDKVEKSAEEGIYKYPLIEKLE